MVNRDGDEIMNQGNGFGLEFTRFTDRFGCGVMKRPTHNNRIWPQLLVQFTEMEKCGEVVKNAKI